MSSLLTQPQPAATRERALRSALARPAGWAATDRARLLKIAVAAGCACGFVLSRRLWLSSVRDYPHAPVAEVLRPPAFPLDFAWLFALFVLLALAVHTARPGKALAAFLVAAGALALFDQSRWQPWFYQYCFMLAALAVFPWRDGERQSNARGDGGEQFDARPAAPDAGRRHAALVDERSDAALVDERRDATLVVGRRSDALDACRLVVAGTYFWGGVQKLNPGFGETMLLLFGRLLPEQLAATLASASTLFVPAVEIFVGVALLTRRFRNVAVAAAVATHAVVLALLVPAGTNTVVWPWNVAMAASVVILFWRARDFSVRGLPADTLRPVTLAAAVLFCALPALSFAGLWDSYLSAALYSGGTSEAVIRLDEAAHARLPPRARRAATREPEGYALSLRRWSFAELNVPAYPEERIFRRVARDVCERTGSPSEVTLEIHRRPRYFGDAGGTQTLGCASLVR